MGLSYILESEKKKEKKRVKRMGKKGRKKENKEKKGKRMRNLEMVSGITSGSDQDTRLEKVSLFFASTGSI